MIDLHVISLDYKNVVYELMMWMLSVGWGCGISSLFGGNQVCSSWREYGANCCTNAYITHLQQYVIFYPLAVVTFEVWSFKKLETKVHMLSVTTTFNITWGSAVDDEAIRKFIMGPQSVGYFLELVTSLKEQTARLVDFVTESAK